MKNHFSIGQNIDLLNDLTFCIKRIDKKLELGELDEYEKCLYISLLKIAYDKICGNNTAAMAIVIQGIFKKILDMIKKTSKKDVLLLEDKKVITLNKR